MKKTVALLLALAMLFCFSACGNPYANITPEQIDQKVDSGELGTLVGYYSVRNEGTDKNSFWVQFDVAMQDSPVYSENSTLVKFFGDKLFYDENGKQIPESELKIGDALVITYNCKTYGDNPVTIKAVRVEKLKVS